MKYILKKKPNSTMQTIYKLFLCSIMVGLDQISKHFVQNLLENKHHIDITSFLRLTEAWNKGMSFGLFSDFKHSNTAFLTITISVTAGLLFYTLIGRTKSMFVLMILSGAIANIIDRIRFGAVYDFISIKFGSLYFPIFNIADCFITLGVIFIFINGLKNS